MVLIKLEISLNIRILKKVLDFFDYTHQEVFFNMLEHLLTCYGDDDMISLIFTLKKIHTFDKLKI